MTTNSKYSTVKLRFHKIQVSGREQWYGFRTLPLLLPHLGSETPKIPAFAHIRRAFGKVSQKPSTFRRVLAELALLYPNLSVTSSKALGSPAQRKFKTPQPKGQNNDNNLDEKRTKTHRGVQKLEHRTDHGKAV